jgi:glutamine amidotransferase
MKVAIIEYNAGNVRSLEFALERLGISPVITSDHELIRTADKVIFPGVGEASSTMSFLKERGLDKVIPSLQQPVLGICLGMQLLCTSSEENNTQCMGVFDVPVKKFIPSPGLKVPHMGWNEVKTVGNSGTINADNSYVYFVHSYYVPVNPWTTLTCAYGFPFSAAMKKENFQAVQFHPEKSAEAGRIILDTFLMS